MCVCVLFSNFVSFFVFFLLWELVYVFLSFVSIIAKKSDRTRCLAVSILGPRYNINWNSKSAERAKAFSEGKTKLCSDSSVVRDE